jgi:hypothetical protein
MVSERHNISFEADEARDNPDTSSFPKANHTAGSSSVWQKPYLPTLSTESGGIKWLLLTLTARGIKLRNS